jgi:hypothetical protein
MQIFSIDSFKTLSNTRNWPHKHRCYQTGSSDDRFRAPRRCWTKASWRFYKTFSSLSSMLMLNKSLTSLFSRGWFKQARLQRPVCWTLSVNLSSVAKCVFITACGHDLLRCLSSTSWKNWQLPHVQQKLFPNKCFIGPSILAELRIKVKEKTFYWFWTRLLRLSPSPAAGCTDDSRTNLQAEVSGWPLNWKKSFYT